MAKKSSAPHTPIFSEKYLNEKFSSFSLKDFIPDLEAKKAKIADWIKGIESGEVLYAKEESIDADFLNTFFGDVLEYEYRQGAEKKNLKKEIKTKTSGQKADGVLGFMTLDGKKTISDVRVAIELKDAQTDLDLPQKRVGDNRTPVQQAFGYPSQYGSKCKWVIVSDFVNIRLYHSSDQSKYELFHIPSLSQENQLKRFIFLLHKDNLISETGIAPIESLFEEKREEEKKITKEFYADYKKIRLELFGHLKRYNPDKEELFLLMKAQKLLDRFLFICFCEDLHLLPEQIFNRIISQVQTSFVLSDTKLWSEIKGLFHSIDKGNPPMLINRFNGGLFATDHELDSLTVKDEVLKNILSLSEYDFESELNVNILGHVFEQSISDIEELKAEIEGGEIEKSKGKRKKDGIFYTPEYITRFIVQEAVGGWLEDRKTEFGYYQLPELVEDDYKSIRAEQGKRKTSLILKYNSKIKKHIEFWEAYREKLTNIKVLDPSCGSGAFLNQVFDYLYREGQMVNQKLSGLKLGQTEVFDLEKHILTTNIYGVDLNQESVEITKLSLWLKTANKYKELTALDENILCGNSLIDDASIVGDKAFHWENRFPKIFEEGGFDVVVGNPPYLRVQLLPETHRQFFEKHYETAIGSYDIYILFIEKLLKGSLKEDGILSLITPSKHQSSNYGQVLAKIIQEQGNIDLFLDFTHFQVFDDATTYTCIFSIKKDQSTTETRTFSIDSDEEFNNFKQSFELKSKVKSSPNKSVISTRTLEKVCKNIFQGFKTGADGIFILDKTSVPGEYYSGFLKKTVKLETDLLKNLYKGGNFKRYVIYDNEKVVIFPYASKNGKLSQITEEELTKFPLTYDYFTQCKDYLSKREKGKFNNNKWFGFSRPQNLELFDKVKLITADLAERTSFSLDTGVAYFSGGAAGGYGLIPNDGVDPYFLIGLLNSHFLNYWIKKNSTPFRGGWFSCEKRFIKNAPIPEIASNDIISENTRKILIENENLKKINNKFLSLLQNDLKISKLSNNLEKWYELSWEQFETELTKKKVNLPLKKKAEWMEVFEEKKGGVADINAKITPLESAINNEVYKLYGIVKEQIPVIEGRVTNE